MRSRVSEKVRESLGKSYRTKVPVGKTKLPGTKIWEQVPVEKKATWEKVIGKSYLGNSWEFLGIPGKLLGIPGRFLGTLSGAREQLRVVCRQ